MKTIAVKDEDLKVIRLWAHMELAELGAAPDPLTAEDLASMTPTVIDYYEAAAASWWSRNEQVQRILNLVR